MPDMLTIQNHRRDSAGLRYVYPVISRRAGGVSIGINLNVNQACNWACVYCQVENLKKGGPPPVDVDRLESELEQFLQELLTGEFMQRHVPPEARQIVDLAFSGDGEPTSATEFEEAIRRVEKVLSRLEKLHAWPVRLISNGSLMHRPGVLSGLQALSKIGGEVWFKLDRASQSGMMQVNQMPFDSAQVARHLIRCAEQVPTWVQTCWFAWDGQAPSVEEEDAYCEFIRPHASLLRGVLLYGLARPSMQPAAPRLQRLSEEALETFADKIRSKTGLTVKVSP